LLVSLKELNLQLPEGIALQSLTNRTIQWLERARVALSKNELAEFLANRRSLGCLKSDPDLQTRMKSTSSSLKNSIEGTKAALTY